MVLLSKMGSEIMWDFKIVLSFKMAFKSSTFRWVEFGFSPSEEKAQPWHICVNHASALWTPETEMKAGCHKNRWIWGHFLSLLNFLSQKWNSRIYHPGVMQCNMLYQFGWYSVILHTISLPAALPFPEEVCHTFSMKRCKRPAYQATSHWKG